MASKVGSRVWVGLGWVKPSSSEQLQLNGFPLSSPIGLDLNQSIDDVTKPMDGRGALETGVRMDMNLEEHPAVASQALQKRWVTSTNA